MDIPPKKPLALVFAADNSHSFALAVALLSLKENSPKLMGKAEVFVYTQNMEQSNKDALLKICPVTFKEFKLPFDSSQIQTIKQYTELTFSRYDCFYMLDSYETVLWLDIDILVMKEADDILNYSFTGMALAPDLNFACANFIAKPCNHFDFEKQNFNAGVMLISDELKNYKEIGDWCYETTRKYAQTLKWPDQAILNIAVQHFKIKVKQLSPIFNTQPLSFPVKMEDVVILHAMGEHKFWNNYPLETWSKFYRQWTNLGGQTMPTQKFNMLASLAFKIRLFLEKDPLLWAIFTYFNKRRFLTKNKKYLKQLENKWNSNS